VKIRSMLATVVALSSLGCTSEPVAEMRIDSSLPLVWQEATITVAEEWFTAVPEARLPILIVDEDANVTGAGCGPHSLGCRGWRGNDRGKIFYEVERVAGSNGGVQDIELRVARHEVGHWLGIRGHLEPGTSMAATIGDTSHELTERDVDALRDNWR